MRVGMRVPVTTSFSIKKSLSGGGSVGAETVSTTLAGWVSRSGAGKRITDRARATRNREEAATFPDNSPAYVKAVNRALAFSTANGVKAASLTAALDKRGIVRLGRRLGAPRALPEPQGRHAACCSLEPRRSHGVPLSR